MIHVSFPGYQKTHFCVGEVSGALQRIWIPCLVFEATLCLLAVYAGVTSRREQLRWSLKTNRPWLVDILIYGNVLYFLRLVFYVSRWLVS